MRAFLDTENSLFKNQSLSRVAVASRSVYPVRIVVALFLSLVVCLSVVITGFSSTSNHKADAGIIDWIACDVMPDPSPELYQLSQSHDLAFQLRSKSTLYGGITDVDKDLNWILEASGMDFKKINEEILGYSLDPSAPEGSGSGAASTTSGSSSTASGSSGSGSSTGVANGGSYVTPFDRFGVAGLVFSGYQGEWKYYVVEACKGGNVSDPKAGLFYQGRLEPMSGWEETGDASKDIRSQQFNSNPVGYIWRSALNTLASMIFWLTKLVVVVTIAFINFSFANLPEVLGFDDLVGGDHGIFMSLFEGIFMPLVVMMFMITAGYLFWHGIVKRQYRKGLTGVLRSILLFFVAFIVAASPKTVISLPNDFSVAVQGIVVSAMNTSLNGGDGMCATDIGAFKSQIVKKSGGEGYGIVQEAAENIKSVVGCKFWQTFLLKPWAQAQFGRDYNELWAEGKIPAWAPSGAKTLGNANTDMVGDAEVPLGGGKVLNNWAVFHISTQTNAHATIDSQGKKMFPINGVMGDWYRIVDAIANYDEEEKTDSLQVDASGSTQDLKYKDVKESNKPLDMWDTWTGNKMGGRFTTSLSSLFIASLGMIAPLFLAALCAAYTIGLAIVMAFAPLFLLLGCWAGKGWEIFKGWGELVINTMMARIVIGILLIITVIMETNILDMTSGRSWWANVLILIIISLVMIKGKDKFIEMAASFRFASFSMMGTAQRVTGMTKKVAGAPLAAGKTGFRMGSNAISGGIGSVKSGGSFTRGLKAGAATEFQALAYRNKGLRVGMEEFEKHSAANSNVDMNTILDNDRYCSVCGKELMTEMTENGESRFFGGRDVDGSLVCRECLEGGFAPDATEFHYKKFDGEDTPANRDRRRVLDGYSKRFSGQSSFSSESVQKRMDKIRSTAGQDLSPSQKLQNEVALRSVMSQVNKDIRNFNDRVEAMSRSSSTPLEEIRESVPTVEVPKEIRPYVDLSKIQAAWIQGNMDHIIMTYVDGLTQWYEDTVGQSYSGNLQETYAAVRDNKLKEFNQSERERIMDEGVTDKTESD